VYESRAIGPRPLRPPVVMTCHKLVPTMPSRLLRRSKSLRAAFRAFDRIARRPWLSGALIGLGALAVSAVMSLGRLPQPGVNDEFSYLLAADTFAHGRLSNPTHPLWVHFESLHIIQQPTYASKYPPGQGLILAAGQAVVGHPIGGAWLSAGLACAAIYWMLLAWLPPRWAVVGGLVAVLHPGLLRWSQSYWGGAVAVIGGALVLGALPRVTRRRRAGDAVLMGVGLAVLANSRPFEGLVLSLPVASALLLWMAGKGSPPVSVVMERVVLPIFVVLAFTGAAMGFYNWRVTGNPLRIPYLVHEATYAVAPAFLWQRPWPEPTYRHKVIRDYYTRLELPTYTLQRSVSGVAKGSALKLKALWQFYLGPVLTVPLVMLPWMLRGRWTMFGLVTCAVFLAALLGERWPFPHYAAPITGLLFALVLQSLRHLRVWRWRGRQVGRYLMPAILVAYVASSVLSLLELRGGADNWSLHRARILSELQQSEGRHLVVVRYGPEHWPDHEWVYNEADIDGARVVWAREMVAAQNRRLLVYFNDRRVWLLEADMEPPRLSPYPVGFGR
jgi:hypothetical protein